MGSQIEITTDFTAMDGQLVYYKISTFKIKNHRRVYTLISSDTKHEMATAYRRSGFAIVLNTPHLGERHHSKPSSNNPKIKLPC